MLLNYRFGVAEGDLSAHWRSLQKLDFFNVSLNAASCFKIAVARQTVSLGWVRKRFWGSVAPVEDLAGFTGRVPFTQGAVGQNGWLRPLRLVSNQWAKSRDDADGSPHCENRTRPFSQSEVPIMLAWQQCDDGNLQNGTSEFLFSRWWWQQERNDPLKRLQAIRGKKANLISWQMRDFNLYMNVTFMSQDGRKGEST